MICSKGYTEIRLKDRRTYNLISLGARDSMKSTPTPADFIINFSFGKCYMVSLVVLINNNDNMIRRKS